MTRENRGLQVALVVFATLSLVLAVAAFVFFQRYEEAALAVQKTRQESEQDRAAARELQGRVGELARLIGEPETAAIENAQEHFRKDMARWAAGLPERDASYRTALARLHDSLQTKNAELADSRDSIQDLKRRIALLEPSAQAPVERHAEAARTAAARVVEVTAEAQRRQQETAAASQSVRQAMLADRQRLEQEKAALQDRCDRLVVDNRDLRAKLDGALARLRELTQSTFVRPDGKIVGVSSRLRMAWIDLGRADSLARQTTFDVYPSATRQLSHDTKKGQVQVTEVLEDHLTEAQIVEEEIGDPIVRGDKVHSAPKHAQ